MSLQTFIAGMWRTPRRAEAYINGAWRRIIRGEVYAAGQWRAIVSFVGPLSVRADDIQEYAYNTTNVTGYSGAYPSGGLGPYRYQWTLLSGPITLGSVNLATVSATASVPYNQSRTGTARVTVTDALGTTASATISISLYSERDTGNQ